MREIPIQKDSTYALPDLLKLVDVSKNQLINLRLFNRVEANLIFTNDSTRAELKIDLIEKWYIWPIPTLEYVDRNVYQWGSFQFDPRRMNYGAYVFFYNVGGRNHTLKASFIDGYTGVIGLEYRIPYFHHKKRWGATLQINHRRSKEINIRTKEFKQEFREFEETAFQNNNAALAIQYKPGYFHHFQAFTSFYHQKTNPLVFEYNKGYQPFEGDIRKVGIGLTWSYSKTDNNIFPWKGKLAQVQLAQNFLNNKIQYAELLASSELYGKFGPRWYYALGFAGRIRGNAEIPFPFQSGLGYRYYVRGYEPYVMDGRNFILFKSELRFSLLNDYHVMLPVKALKMYREMVTRSHLSLFADAGNVNYYYPFNQIDYPYWWFMGAGVGLNFALYYDKVVRFEYSRNLSEDWIWNIRFNKSL